MSNLVEVGQGDITSVEADAIVNAANSDLAMGGGVCGAIFRAAGVVQLTAACRVIGKCPTGSAAITPSFGIKTAKYIIHAVGPVYSSYAEAEARELLRSAYRNSIALAVANGCKSIAFPAIGTGIYGYPLDDARKEAVGVCVQEAPKLGIRVMLVAFDSETEAALNKYRRRAPDEL